MLGASCVTGSAPFCSLIGFMFSSAARIHGFEQDLHLKGEEFATLLSILYVGYIIMQVPSYVSFLSSRR